MSLLDVEISDEMVHALLTDEDGVCSDLECWRCHSPLRPENLRRLAGNIAAAAALCRAWQLGAGWCNALWTVLDPIHFEVHHDLVAMDWKPGCGRPAPTIEELLSEDP